MVRKNPRVDSCPKVAGTGVGFVHGAYILIQDAKSCVELRTALSVTLRSLPEVPLASRDVVPCDPHRDRQRQLRHSSALVHRSLRIAPC
jgi:hypothetical protein